MQLLVLGPIVGFVIGGAGAWALAYVDGRMGVRREYQALYGIGLVLAAYAVSTAVGGDGFLGAFFAGLAVVVLNQTLCDCFLEYGEITSEMAMLFAFVLFGAVLSGLLQTTPIVDSLILALLVVFIIRPSILGVVLSWSRMSWEAHAFISWFGPRGLNSLLLALLLVQADVPGAVLMLGVVGIVVLVSVTVHGASATPIMAWYERRAAEETLQEEREGTAAGLFTHDDNVVERISPEGLSDMLAGPNPPLVLDVRSRSSYEHDNARIPDDVRVLPDEVVEWAEENPKERLVVAYCT